MRLLKIYFHLILKKEKNINDTNYLLSLGAKYGLQNVDLDSQVESVKKEANSWNKGIDGVPFFSIGKPGGKKYVLSGAQPTEAFISIFNQLC